jgi:MFS family permease
MRTGAGRPLLPQPVGFGATSAAMVAVLAAAGAPTPLLPIYEREWGFASWKLTLAFGVYALALLVTILITGSLSDHIGRRPVMIAALAVVSVAMLIFLNASSINWLIVGRIVQGVGTGAASSVLSAAVVELASERQKRLGALMTGMAPLAGLGVGSLFAGVLAQYVGNAAPLVWLVLAVVMIVGTVLAVFTPETSSRKPGALASLRPQVLVPPVVRGLFASTLPGIVAVFLFLALFLGLVPTVLGAVFAVRSPIIGALVAVVAFTIGTAVSALTRAVRPHRLRLLGSAAMVIGAVFFVAAVGVHSLALVWAAAVLSGAGLGAAFAGSTRGLAPEVQPHQRGGLFAALYLVAYFAMGMSAIIAGLFVKPVGVTAMAIGFGVVIAVTALLGVIVTASHSVRRPALRD